MEVYDDLQFNTICRICFKPSPILTSIFESDLCTKVQEIASIQIQADDGLPSNLCNECIYEILRCNEFKELIVKTDTKLRSILTYRQEKRAEIDNEIINDDATIEKLDEIEFESSLIEITENVIISSDDENEDIEPLDTPEPNSCTTDTNVEITDKNTARGEHKCDLCAKKFPSQRNLIRHNWLIHGVFNSIICDKCGKSFKYLCQFMKHCCKFYKDLKFTCDICSRVFKRKHNLDRHIKTHMVHELFKCARCNSSFTLRVELEKHMDKKHKNQCKYCNIKYKTKCELQKHIRTHTVKKPFQCSFCNKTFTSRFACYVHELMHTSEKPQHTVEKPFSCNVCQRQFGQSSAFKRHMKIHNNK